MTEPASLTLLVASDDAALLDEVLRYLEAIPGCRILAAARSPGELATAMATGAPDGVVISGGLAVDLAESGRGLPITRLAVVEREQRADVLRAAVELGARGVVRWPQERDELRRLVGDAAAGGTAEARPGDLTALWGPKGGSGTSVLAAHLAGALAALGADCLLVDLDLAHGDQTAILGAGPESRSLADLLRVAGEITRPTVDAVAWRHPRGFRAVLAPEPGTVPKPSEVAPVLTALRSAAGHLVADLPSGDLDAAAAVCAGATRLLLVVTPDILALRRGRDSMRGLIAEGLDPERVDVILNRSDGGEITPGDVEAVLLRPVAARIRPDLGLLRAPDRGELSASGLRLLDGIARRICGLPDAGRGLARLARR